MLKEKTLVKLYADALSQKERGSEALVWLADLFAKHGSQFSEEEKNEFFTSCSKKSPFVRSFKDGLRVEKHPDFDGYRIVTTRRILKGEILISEAPAVKYDSSVFSGWKTKYFVEEFKDLEKRKKCFSKLNGLFPRKYEDIPKTYFEKEKFQNLKPSILSILPEATEAERKEFERIIVCIRLNCHPDGVHQFVDFANNSCENNCFYSGVGFEGPGTSIKAERDIEVGEEITCNYGRSSWDSLATRRADFLRSYGSICFCSKCIREENELFTAKVQEEDNGLWFFKTSITSISAK